MKNSKLERLEKFETIGSDDVEVKVQGVLVEKGKRGNLRPVQIIYNVRAD